MKRDEISNLSPGTRVRIGDNVYIVSALNSYGDTTMFNINTGDSAHWSRLVKEEHGSDIDYRVIILPRIPHYTDAQLTQIYNTANNIGEGKSPPITTEKIFNAMRAMVPRRNYET